MTPRSKILIGVLIAAGIAISIGTVVYLSQFKGSAGSKVRTQDVLIIASIDGFNDSALPPCAANGQPQMPCPVVQVPTGTLVNFTVRNIDKQAHGFQVQYYLESPVEVIAPGQSINVTFVANKPGTYRIYCDIPCTVHWAMQSGELIVS